VDESRRFDCSRHVETNMLLTFRTVHGASNLEWAHYALLRDNVQHYLESAPGAERFKTLHAIERAVDGDARYLRAVDLRREIQRAWTALGSLPLGESAVSLRTALLSLGRLPPFVRWTFKACATSWRLPVQGDAALPLRHYLGAFVEAILIMTDGASHLEDICVTRARSKRGREARY
jgi:hypothetical protein